MIGPAFGLKSQTHAQLFEWDVCHLVQLSLPQSWLYRGILNLLLKLLGTFQLCAKLHLSCMVSPVHRSQQWHQLQHLLEVLGQFLDVQGYNGPWFHHVLHPKED